ncbi:MULTISPECIES: hypothetical protein [unclassified Mesorhizobium]|uniref:methylation-associated defense system protein MAD4 n=1 Tax=unclassified Mesorhizobium TaxID=325217 RepID=UPI000FCAC8A5|nr:MULTISPECIES: hypothetical protein [unclassified Mesorhizobium]RUV68327.1 hypothetical protein EOA78_27180 [Mesorhizobium sp. M5C.F.Cr.IN.023.01.1.1]RWE94164.1 MAG: hypothetical protein EOS43_27490 [Mesorhizobium sp.]RWJ06635.1 MAG: hypothetical protein EOR24_25625 [Mesorhizobium sp.]RWJ11133.1 MAG: hypothetical protein EOR25_32035 [Mesorhizobium sp.]RWJ61341.1 MAG: hypothetical protein EOR33_27280 [Mesorhizobium sp.]
MSRQLIILTADGTMAAVMRAFFERQFHHALACAPFQFDPTNDIVHDPLNTDGGVHLYCQEILRRYLKTHRRALVVLDQQFGAERSAEKVRGDIEHRLNANGWDGRCAAVVIDPELEVLLWQDNPHVERALRHTGPSLRQLLAQDGRWPSGAAKPLEPKEVIQALIRANRAGPPMVVYSQIARAVATAGCVDPAFYRVRDMLRAWFPAEAT